MAKVGYQTRAKRAPNKANALPSDGDFPLGKMRTANPNGPIENVAGKYKPRKGRGK